MARPIRKDNQFQLVLQLPDGNASQFVQARIYDASFAEVSFSPITLSHLANGLYRDISEQATAIGNYTVQYTVFSNAGLTTRARKYGIVKEDVFVFDYDQLILAAINLRPTNPVLTTDSRLNNLNTIPTLATTTQLNDGLATQQTAIIDTVTDNTDDSDGRAV